MELNLNTNNQPNNESSNFLDSPNTNSAPSTSMQSPSNPKRKLTKLIIIIVTIVLLITASGIGYLVFRDKTKPDPKTLVSKSIIASISNISSNPLAKSFHSNGFTTGYVEKKPKTSSVKNLLSQKVSAAEEDKYDHVVFYKDISSSLIMLNTTTRETKEIVKDGKSAVFSSINQSLSFQRDCSVFNINLNRTSESEVLLQKGKEAAQNEKDSICYKPLSWSPDGKKLAIHGLYVTNSEEIGLVGFVDLYIYDTETKTIKKVEAPEGYNNLGALNWNGNDEVVVYYLKFGKYAAKEKEQIYSYSLLDEIMSPINFTENIELNTVQIVGDTIYARDSLSNVLLAAKKGASEFTKISNSEDVQSFLVNLNNPAGANTLYVLKGQLGVENSTSLLELNTLDGSTKALTKLEGFAVSILGFGNNNTEIIYISILSGKSAVQSYDITTGKNERLIDNLPLIIK